MNLFRKRAASRIALGSVALALVTSPLAWWWEIERAEEGIVALAMEECSRLLTYSHALDLGAADAKAHAGRAVATIVGGLFDIAEIYDAEGVLLASAATTRGEDVESRLPNHGPPKYREASYESAKLADLWVLRVFVPLRDPGAETAPPTGYFEGVRVVPAWQREQIQTGAFGAAAIVGLAALLCGALIYPIVVRLADDNDRKAREVLDSHISMMDALGRAIARRDSDTGAHNYRVAWIAARVGEEMGLSGAAMQSLIAGSFLHDVGKIGIPDAILLKPGRLDRTEMATMRTHVEIGEGIVRGMGWLDGAHAVVAGHHEKWNGSGYPRGSVGEQIPLAARIFAIADVFDALASRRPYKEPMPFDAVMTTLRGDVGTHFDPAAFAVFETIADEVHTALGSGDEDAARALLEARIRRHFEI